MILRKTKYKDATNITACKAEGGENSLSYLSHEKCIARVKRDEGVATMKRT